MTAEISAVWRIRQGDCAMAGSSRIKERQIWCVHRMQPGFALAMVSMPGASPLQTVGQYWHTGRQTRARLKLPL